MSQGKSSDDVADLFGRPASSERSRALYGSYRRKTLESFLDAIASAAEGLEMDLDHIRARIQRLDPAKPLAPGTFEAFSQLAGALRSGNVTHVVDRLKHIQVAPDETFSDTAFRVESALSEPWERSVVLAARAEVEEVGDTPMILRPLLEKDPSHLFTDVFTARKYIEEVAPGIASELGEYVTRVKLFRGRGFLGFSSPRAFGAIYMRLPDENPVEYLSLIHI